MSDFKRGKKKPGRPAVRPIRTDDWHRQEVTFGKDDWNEYVAAWEQTGWGISEWVAYKLRNPGGLPDPQRLRREMEATFKSYLALMESTVPANEDDPTADDYVELTTFVRDSSRRVQEFLATFENAPMLVRKRIAILFVGIFGQPKGYRAPMTADERFELERVLQELFASPRRKPSDPDAPQDPA